MDKKNKERLERFQQLFQWRAPVEIIAPGGDVVDTLYQRLVGDADLNKARTTALRFSREMRVKLRDKDSDEYLAYVDTFADYTKDEIITLLLFNELQEIRENIEKDFIFPEPKEPDSETTTEELEEYQEQDDTYEERRNQALIDKVEAALMERKDQLFEEEIEKLRQALILSQVNNLCETELRNKFIQMCVYLGTFIDEEYKQHAFGTFDEFLDSPDILKEQLITAYNKLEVASVNLKGLPKVTPSEPLSP